MFSCLWGDKSKIKFSQEKFRIQFLKIILRVNNLKMVKNKRSLIVAEIFLYILLLMVLSRNIVIQQKQFI